LAADGLALPLIFRTNCKAAARISSSVTGGSKLDKGLMFLHMLRASMLRFDLLFYFNSCQYSVGP
jgi:hypothetical protein